MKPERWILTAVLLALALSLLVSPARAQMGDMQGRVEDEMRRTEEIIQRAADMARDAGNAQAGELVKKAMELQNNAQMSFGNGRYVMAGSQTKLARELAQRAMALMQRPEERLERVEFELQRTDELIAGARDHAGPDWPEGAQAILEGAMRQQEQAWEYYRASQLRPALRLTLRVRQQLRRLDRRMSNAVPEGLRARFAYTQQIVKQASDEAAESGERQRMALAQRAREMLARAEEKIAAGHPKPALQHMEQAERFARQSMQAGPGGGPPDDMEAAATRYEARMALLENRLADHPSREATRLMEESQEHFRLARELAGQDNGGPGEVRERAMAELRIAMRLMERALELVQ